TAVPRPSTVSPVSRAWSAGRCRQMESAECPGGATTWISQPVAVIVSPGARPPSPSREGRSAGRAGGPGRGGSPGGPRGGGDGGAGHGGERGGTGGVVGVGVGEQDPGDPLPGGGDLVTDAVQVASVAGARIHDHRPG